ncbi:MAG: hypothetical protein QOF32_338, partial [Gammaproteobacteria bacterium]|nr:hypothetical protein [Gammaproteobacteria bacterium]
RNSEGVVLRYPDHDTPGRHHVEQRAQPTDAERMAALKAEKGLTTIEIILDHLDVSDIAKNRLDDALRAIYEALQLKRPRLGLCVIEVEQAA